jgi:nitrogen fixation-related uncharacterized protein
MFTQEVTIFTIFTTIAIIIVFMAIGIFFVKNKKIED